MRRSIRAYAELNEVPPRILRMQSSGKKEIGANVLSDHYGERFPRRYFLHRRENLPLVWRSISFPMASTSCLRAEHFKRKVM
jgi:hypothetical protein